MLRRIIKINVIGIGLILITYLLLSNITVNNNQDNHDDYIYLYDNGVHVDIIIPDSNIYVSYGWGSKIFYTQVPTWDDLTFELAFKALFTHPESMMNVSHYNRINSNWVKVFVSKEQHRKLVENINKEFTIKSNYNIFNTCNTWVNKVLRDSGLKSCIWTPFSRDIIKMYN